MLSLVMLPNIVALLMLMGVLAWLRRENRDKSVKFWLVGLAFVLVEAVAVAVFRGSEGLKVSSHVIALDAYVLAGSTFGWAARGDRVSGRSKLPFFVLPAVPLLVINTLYGLGVTDARPYIATALFSLGAGFLYVFFAAVRSTWMRATLIAMHLGFWLPMTLMAFHGSLRWLVYWGLGCLYLLVAFSFRSRVRPRAIGGLVIMAGFVIWAGCFMLHPLQNQSPMFVNLLDQLWTMQKFVVILGMLLTLLEDSSERLKLEAMHDPLTALPNRRLFDDRLEQALERSIRSGLITALFVVDLDGFKAINDSQGHNAGDLVLQAAAARLKSKVRTSDTLARCGGDEFCVIVNDIVRVEDCERIAEGLRSALETMPDNWITTDLSGSVGYAMFPIDANDKDKLAALADRRMYEDKRARARLKELQVDHLPRLVEQGGR